ncbi:MAG: M36 family metallopeptidase [Myxococcales bacterium]|nr:M36 family metallopeptidase [Myxococcales bacterium]
MLVAPSADLPPAGASAEEAARFHLKNQREAWKVGRAALSDMRLRFVHDLGRGGVIVSLRQQLAGVEVFHGDVKILLDRNDNRLLGVVGAPHPAAVPGNRQRFTLGKTEAINKALADLYGEARANVRLAPTGVQRGGWQHFNHSEAGLKFREDARVKPVYFPVGDALVPAWFTEVQVRVGRVGEVDAFQHVIAADDGRLLYRRNLTADAMYKYRVWAEPGGDRRPLDGPTEDWSPHPTGAPDLGPTKFTIPTLVQLEGLNHNPLDQPDPWLPAGATTTNGNNADAYVDWTAPDGLTMDMNEFRAPTSAPGTFDYIYNTAAEPLATTNQSRAAIVQLFYDVNWQHDWWYDSGFVEATGVAQKDNYGRGGVDGDAMKAEAQDGAITGSRNNANMNTPADGMQPRMQMFLWTPIDKSATLTIDPAATMTTPNVANFGKKNFDVTADLVLMNDGTGTTTDGCTAAMNDISGKIVLIDRGSCNFESKVNLAQSKGAVGALIANNTGGNLPLTLGGDNAMPDPTIGAFGITQNDGAALKAALMNGPQSAHMVGVVGLERDGTIDNMIVAHEFGHYWHHRLQECGSKMCSAMSEGWGDFNAIMQALKDGDDLDGTYADGTYASFDKFSYFGIRRVPYSVDFEKNALTFKHVTDGVALPNTHPVAQNASPNSEVHNAGEVWTTAVWEAYIALHKANEGKLSFEQVHRLMSDYLVSGLMLTAVDPDFTEQRDAILMAARANSEMDFLTMANAFARRGLGSCAVSPAKDSTTFAGVVEDFELHANGTISGLASISDDVLSCDDDGIVDVGEIGTLKVKVVNVGALELPKGSTLEVIDPPAGLVFPAGMEAVVDKLAPFQAQDVGIQVALDDKLVDNDLVTLKFRLNTPNGCVDFTEGFLPVVINADLAPISSSTDDVETSASVWKIGGALSDTVWSRQPALTDGWYWHGADIGTMSDTNLMSPLLSVAGEEPFMITFDHRYTFEFSDNTNWDGGLVEVSDDDGMTWKDAKELGAAPSYNGKINSMVNPINGKDAYVHRNASYPERDVETLDFGMALAGKAVRFRFRIGTDGAAGDLGWDIDNITFSGITNQPFPSWIPDAGECSADTTGSTGGEESSGTSGGLDDTSGSETSAGTDETSAGTNETSADTSAGTNETSAGTNETSAGSVSDSDSNGSTPTSSDTSPSGPSSADEGDEEGASETSGDPGETVDDGCGCDVEGRGWGWQALPWLALLGLGRRRRSAA